MSDEWTKERDASALEWETKVGGDCLCQRTVPGTPVGEHIYSFCGCHLFNAFQAGADFGRSFELKRSAKLVEALHDVKEWSGTSQIQWHKANDALNLYGYVEGEE